MKHNVPQPSMPEGDPQVTRLRRVRDTLMAGGTLGIAVTVVCCAAPLILIAFGVGAAWIGFFTDLERYLLPVLVVAAACIIGGVWLNRKLAQTSCAVGTCAAEPLRAAAKIDPPT